MTRSTSTTSPPEWQADASLDSTIRFDQPPSTHTPEPRRVLLTGATGFLGAHLLSDLLLESGAHVLCLVRSSPELSGAQRLRAHMEQLGLWRPAFEDRITAISGDLSLPLLGLSRAQFDALAEPIDSIYHCGTHANFLRPYAALRATNVLGTQEILRLAGSGRTKPVHYVSTLAVFFGRAHLEAGRVSEADTPVLDPGVKSGYVQTKWVAERLVLSARERGLPAAIYRPGRITGHSRTGATSNAKDLLNRLLKGCILLGSYPALSIDIPMIPVDYVSRAITHLAKQPRSMGRAFHLFQPQPIAWQRLVRTMTAQGYPMVALDYDQWRAALKRAASDGHPERESLAELWMVLSSPNSLLEKRPSYEAPYSAEGLLGTDIACPPSDERLIATYLSFFQKSGYIPPPQEMRREP